MRLAWLRRVLAGSVVATSFALLPGAPVQAQASPPANQPATDVTDDDDGMDLGWLGLIGLAGLLGLRRREPDRTYADARTTARP